MDLSSPEWQAVAMKTADLVTDQLGARGVYLDVVGNVQEGSWSADGHHPGRGRWVTSAARNLVSQVAKRSQLTVVEGALEQMSGISDAGVNYFATPEDMIPLFPLVYHERFILAGLRSLPPDDRLAMRVKNGLAFVWGLHPGLGSLQWEKPDRKRNVDWVLKLVKMKIDWANWLSYGEYMGPVDQSFGPSGSSMRIRSWSSMIRSARSPGFDSAEIERSPIEAHLYRGADDQYAVVLINLSEKREATALSLPVPFERRKVKLVAGSSEGQRSSNLSAIDGRYSLVMEPGAISRLDVQPE